MEELFNDVSWCFGARKYDSYETFIKDLTKYIDRITQHTDEKQEWEPNAVFVSSKRVKIVFDDQWDGTDGLFEVVVASDGADGITVGEALYRLNNEA